MLISEIFDSIDGEGVRAGEFCTFIRVTGCNLRCSYCDSMYAVEPWRFSGPAPREMQISDILACVNRDYKRVTLTGGEPLLLPESIQLVNRLCDLSYEVNIETNGSCDIVVFRDFIREKQNLFFTVDFKLPSSGEMYKMLLSNFDNLNRRDVLKFVIGTDEDAEIAASFARDLTEKYGMDAPYIYCGTVFGKYPLSKVIDIFKKDPALADVRFQLQMQKYIWDPDLRGV